MDQNRYYEEYYKNGGEYTCEAVAAPTSRVLQILHWVQRETKPGDRILDIGCGDMYLSTRLPDREWVGLDLNVEKSKGKAYKFDAMCPPYPVEPGFDAVVSSEFLEHVWDLRVVHKEAYRLLKSGGVYIISTPNFNWIDNILGRWVSITFDPARPWTMEHIRHYTGQIHQKHLQEAGFKVEDATGLDAHYGVFFQEARSYLQFLLTKVANLPQYEDSGMVDSALGRMFPDFSHTIALLSRKGDLE